MGGLVSWIVWGLFVGALARLLVPGRQSIGVIWTMLLGIAGSVAGGYIATDLIGIGDADRFDLGSFIIAVLTSAVLLAVVERIDRALPDRRPRGRLGRRDRVGRVRG